MVRPLPVIEMNGKRYFVDYPLCEVRNVHDFSDAVRFASDAELESFIDGRRCRQFTIS